MEIKETKMYRVSDTETGNYVLYEGTSRDEVLKVVLENNDIDVDVYCNDNRIWCGSIHIYSELEQIMQKE